MSDVDGALESQTPKNDAVENVVERYRATISDLSRPIPRLSALLAVLLQAAVITLLIVSNFVTIWIRKPNLANGTGLSDSDRLLYLTGTTILATIISSFTVGQIRSLWFSLALSEVERGMSDKVLGKMRSVIGLALAHEKAKNFPITASYWVVGLITTAIVAGISPTNFPLILPAITSVALDHTGAPTLAGGPLCFNVANTSLSASSFEWELSNGSYISLNTSYNPNCDTQNVLPSMWNLPLTPKGEAYMMGAIPVGPLSAGVPYTMSQGFEQSFGLLSGDQFYSPDAMIIGSTPPEFNWVSQCFPMVAKNPVACRQQGSITVSGTNITVESNGCSASKSFSSLNTAVDPAMVVGICTGSSNKIGTATIVIGATNSYASELGTALNLDVGVQSLSALCSIDIAPTITFRNLNYSRTPANAPEFDDGPDGAATADYPYYIHASGNCEPLTVNGTVYISQIITESMLATGASAAWQLLSENQYTDGYLQTLLNAVNNIQPVIGKTFAASQNYLEDVLGQASAIALGFFWGATMYAAGLSFESSALPLDPDNSSLDLLNGNASFSGVRVGPGTEIAVLYILPEVFAAWILIWLLYKTRDL